jgi:nitroreductase
MELMDVIRQRRTVRMFKPDLVSDEVLNEILEAATWGPSHFNAQPWEFILIGPETRQKLIEVYRQIMENGPLKNPELPEERKQLMRKFMQDFGGAPVLLAVTCPPTTIPTDKLDYPLAAAAAIQNIQLSAWDKQIGSVWLSLGQAPQVPEILKLQSDYSIIGIIAMGAFDNVPPAPPRIPVAEKLHRLP